MIFHSVVSTMLYRSVVVYVVVFIIKLETKIHVKKVT